MFNIKVPEGQRALLYKDEKFIKLLGVGKHKLLPISFGYKVERFDASTFGISKEKAVEMLRVFEKEVQKNFSVVKLEDKQRAFIFIDNKFAELLDAGECKLYWNDLNITVKLVNLSERIFLTDEEISYIKHLKTLPNGIKKVEIEPYSKGYLYKNKKFIQELEAKSYYLFDDCNELEVKIIDTRLLELELHSQEILSKDKVTIRCNATMHYKIIDGLLYLHSVDDASNYLYKQMQFALRKHIGRLNIDEILSMQHTISDELVTELKKEFEKIGVRLEALHIKDIILPGEMREIFNQVIEASKRAEANNIKRREETAAMRSMLNSAKLMKDNPILLRLKELEALEGVVEKIDTINVYNGLEGLKELIKI